METEKNKGIKMKEKNNQEVDIEHHFNIKLAEKYGVNSPSAKAEGFSINESIDSSIIELSPLFQRFLYQNYEYLLLRYGLYYE